MEGWASTKMLEFYVPMLSDWAKLTNQSLKAALPKFRFFAKVPPPLTPRLTPS
jgi:hypothetical protein